MGGDHLGDDAEPWQDHDVHRGMRVEPEDVLVGQGRTTAFSGEEVRPHLAIEHGHEHRASDERRSRDDERRGSEVGPAQQRHAEQRHARSAHGHDRDEEVDRGGDRGATRDDHADLEERLPERALILQRGVGGPTRVVRAVGPGGQQDHAGQRQQPERHCVEAGEGHIVRADHQRDDVVADTGEDRNHEREDHDRAVRRDQLVVLAVGDRLHTGLGQLGAEHLGKQTTDEIHDEREDDVLDADHLVIGVELEVVPPRLRAVLRVVVRIELPTGDPGPPVIHTADADDEADAAEDVGDGQERVLLHHRVHVEDRATRERHKHRKRGEQRRGPETTRERGAQNGGHRANPPRVVAIRCEAALMRLPPSPWCRQPTCRNRPVRRP